MEGGGQDRYADMQALVPITITFPSFVSECQSVFGTTQTNVVKTGTALIVADCTRWRSVEAIQAASGITQTSDAKTVINVDWAHVSIWLCLLQPIAAYA